MHLQTILSSLIVTYLAFSPCLALQHDNNDAESKSVATEESHSHSHAHNEDAEAAEGEHCCDDLSSSLHAPVKVQLLSAIVASNTENTLVEPFVLTQKKGAYSRDGPLYSFAKEHTKTTVMLS